MYLSDLVKLPDLAEAENNLRLKTTCQVFKKFLPDDPDKIWLTGLNRFAIRRPWSFWDSEVIDMALGILEKNIKRSLESIAAWSQRISVALNDILAENFTSDFDLAFYGLDNPDFLKISNSIHPQYLRFTEQIFGNLLTPLFGVLRKKGVMGNFDIERDKNLFGKDAAQIIFSGFDTKIRNGIAHGEVHYKGKAVVYGRMDTPYEYKVDVSDLIHNLDQMHRVSNGLICSIFLFGIRNKVVIEKEAWFKWPLGLINILIIENFKRDGFEIEGIVDAENQLAGSQLQVSFRTNLRKRDFVLVDSLRIVDFLMKINPRSYNRHIFSIDSGEELASMMIFDVKKFEDLAKSGKPIQSLQEVLETSLLWCDENDFSSKIKLRKYLFKSHYALFLDTHFRHIRKRLFDHERLYRVRHVENSATDTIHRLKINAVLMEHNDALSEQDIKRIVHEIVCTYRFLPTRSKRNKRFPTRITPGLPTYIWVTLFRKDDPKRWLNRRGWMGGNILCSAEWISSSKYPAIAVKNPESHYKGIRFQFRMDQNEYVRAMASVQARRFIVMQLNLTD